MGSEILRLLLLALLLPSSLALCHRTECNCTAARTGGRASLCHFSRRQMLELNGSDFPDDLSSVEMSGGRELRFGTEVFARLVLLEFVRVSSVSKVFVREHSFANMSASRRVRFEFEEGSSLILEGSSWKNVVSPVTVSISGFQQVIIQGRAFSYLDELVVRRVARLELLENAFFIEMPKHNASFTIKSIVLDEVKLENLAGGTFHSLTSDVRIRSSGIGKVRGEAFNAIMLHHVALENTTLGRLETGAFSDRTILHTLTIDRVSLDELMPNAVLSGATHLHVHHSRFRVLHTGGFNMTVANVAINYNIFNQIHSRAFTLKQWDSLSINNNTFKKLEPEAFHSQGLDKIKPPVINFNRNYLIDIPSSAFDFAVHDELNPSIDSNFFHFKCHCDMSKLVVKMMKPFPLSDALYETGFCTVDPLLSKCYGLPEGFSIMRNFTEEVCSSSEVILCEEVQRDAEVPPLPGISSNVDIEYEDELIADRRVLGSVFIVVLLGMLVMMLLSTFMWVGRNGYCAKARLLLFPSTSSVLSCLSRLFSGGGVSPTGSAHSISRLSIHEYAELQRNLAELKKGEEEEVPLEDKATQTLPEELTQELLQSLQEKLNDPENYSEARNMIEHLYDLIKVEESCNKNYKDSHSINMEELENVYDVIVPRRKTSSPRSKKEMVSTGTRAPSPDKLLPYPIYGETRKGQPVTSVSDYMEPRDRKVHTYTELPGGRLVEDKSSAGRYAELPPHLRMANRPLPSKPVSLQGEALS